jgi:two-component system phosphate regulon sensor histidine kinase PhoR
MRNKLFWKLGLSYLLLPFLVLLAVDFFTVRSIRLEAERAGFERLTLLARMAVAQAPGAQDPQLSAWAKGLAKSGARVTLVGPDGCVLADSERNPADMENHAGRPEVRDAMARGEGRAIRYSETVQRDLLYLALHVAGMASRPGADYVVRVAVPVAEISEAVEAARLRLWGASLVTLLLAGFGALLLARALAARIFLLKDFSERVASGDLRPVAVERTGDELSELARSLNATAAQLERSMRSLEAEKNQSAAILRSMVEGVAAIRADGTLLFVNDAFCRELALRAANVEGRAMVEVIRQQDLLRLVQVAQGGKGPTVAEVTLAAEGTTRAFSVTAAPVRTEGGQGVVLVLHDITELRRLERVRRDFVANVSHEFKTPLTAIQGFAETLLGGALEDAANRRRFVEIMREHAARLARLTDDLLTLSRIEAGKLHLEFQPVTVAELVELCAEATQLKASHNGLSLTWDIRPDLPAVRGDLSRLAEVLQNLLDNAVQYTLSGGRIAVRADVAPDGQNLVISVSDTGMGIPLHEQQRIFERFYRVDVARSREAGGTGLGLSIAKHLAEAHGGHIEVQSEVGRGSVFSLFLPAC